ncbi:hypothetical protein BPAE_0038g00010 [Botrytis paeoniae]|uniref:Uncharacterized protein n=1 Tax=Botrytis paeoniae TaxID=278948 RepID=A0A4Z1FT04_9HELO|nr:hypothetical protein BPAE_0038g00010 [Botrytis paeoniae]
MASDLSAIAENDNFGIKLNNSESFSEVLHLKIQEAPETWMRIQGSHSIINPETSQQLRSDEGDDLEVTSVDKRDENSSTFDEEVIQRSCQTVVDLANKGHYKGMTVEKCTLDIDHTSLRKTLRGITNHVVYGGNINVTLRNTTSLTTYQDQSFQKEGKNIHMKAIWTFDWLGLEHGLRSSNNTLNNEQPRLQQTWSGRLKAAMVDNEQGWIDRDDPIPGGIQFTRALKKFDLVYDRTEDSVHYEDGQELERVGILGATIAPGNSVTVIHRQHVSPALFNRIKNLELANNGARARRAEQENKLASQASRIQSLESRLQNQEQQFESQAIEIKTLQTEIIDLRTSKEADMITIKHHDHLIKNHREFLQNRVIKDINSFREASKSQNIKINDQARELDEKLALYKSIFMENQERELSEKLALYEANLLHKVKKIILAELLGSETQPSDDIGGKNEPRIRGS